MSQNNRKDPCPFRTVRIGGHRLARILAAFALTVVGTACTNSHPVAQSTITSSSPTRPAKPTPADRNLRDVTKAMIYGDGIAHVLPETAAQMICGALSPAEWHRTVGGDVGRTVYGGVGAKCVVSTGASSIELQMTVEALGAEGERIAGRRVKVDDSSSSKRVAAASAAVVPLGEQDIPAQQRVGAEPVLHLLARMIDMYQPAPDLPALLRHLLAMLLPRLNPASGPATPVYDAAGKLTYIPAESVAGVAIYDLPQTVQSLVLCTIVLQETGIRPQSAGIFVNSVSECNISKPRIFAKVDQFLPPLRQQFSIAGLPAQEVPNVGIVIDLLTMPAEYDRIEHLALRLTNYKPSAQLRAWVEMVAPRLLNT